MAKRVKRRGPDKQQRKIRPPNPQETMATKENGKWNGNDKGPPVQFTEERIRELALEVCTRIAGGETLREICQSEHMPAFTTFYEWKMGSKELADAYSCARVDQAHTWADKIKEMVDDTDDKNWKPRQIQIGALQWLCARLHPHQYSDKLQITADVSITGEVVHKLATMSTEELDKFILDQQAVGKRALYGPVIDVTPETGDKGS